MCFAGSNCLTFFTSKYVHFELLFRIKMIENNTYRHMKKVEEESIGLVKKKKGGGALKNVLYKNNNRLLGTFDLNGLFNKYIC